MLDKKTLKEQFTLEAEAMGLDVQVFSDGPINSQVVFIGEGPGETEVRKGSPFVGGSGNLLWNNSRHYGFSRHNVYVTNVVKRQISISPTSDDKYKVTAHELALWESLLVWELQQLPNIRVICCLGNMAMKAITGLSGITDWRGSVIDARLEDRPVKVLCTNNPAFIQRELRLEPVLFMDMRKLRDVVDGKYKEHQIEEIINPTYKDAIEYIEMLIESDRPVALDIETPAWETGCVGVSNDSHEAMCINFRDGKDNRFSLQEELDIWRRLQRMCDEKRIITQNAYDRYFLWIKNWLVMPVWMDTLLAHHTLYPQLPHGLGFLVSQYANTTYYKDQGKQWREGGNIDNYWRYNCKDVAFTYHIHKPLLRELRHEGMEEFFFNHVMRVYPYTTEATVHGVAVDEQFRSDVQEVLEHDVQHHLNEFYRLSQELTGEFDIYPNPDSHPQVRELLFNRLGLRGRGKSVDKANRQRMLDDPKTGPGAKELLTVLDKYKTQSKLNSTYFQSKTDEDGRMRCEYRQFGTQKAPGRLSSAATLWGSGMNLQNQPEKARPMFVADPGCVFIYFDLSQAEARIVGWYYAIDQWIDDFERARLEGGFDAHRALAAQMFKMPYDETPEKDFDDKYNPTKRYIAKRCRHGLNYRMMESRLAETTGLSYSDAKRAFHLYHQQTPELRRGWERVEREARRTRELYNAYGRRWKILQRFTKDAAESIIAFFPQSTVGDKVSRVWYKSMEDDDWPTGRARIALNIHDALIGIAEPRVAKTALAIMKKHAEEPIRFKDLYGNDRELIIPAECKISIPTRYEIEGTDMKFTEDEKRGFHRWAKMKDIEI